MERCQSVFPVVGVLSIHIVIYLIKGAAHGPFAPFLPTELDKLTT